MKKKFCIWVCVDDKKIGTWKQAEALASRLLNGEYKKKPVNLPIWCKWIPSKLFVLLPQFIKKFAVKEFTQYLPDLIIAAGRQAVLVAIALRHNVKTIVLMNPEVHPHYFDVVIAPEHDKLTGTNVITTQGALHGIEPMKLIFPEYLKKYSMPKIGVLLGGNSVHGRYERPLAAKLANDLKKLCSNGASLLITPSRRTPLEWLEVFEKNLEGVSYWIWDQKSENPYPTLLGGVDAVVVCEDSISMASEACITGKPVLIYPTGIKKEKFRYFYQQLFSKGYAKHFSVDIDIYANTQFPVLKEVDTVVEQVKKMIKLS